MQISKVATLDQMEAAVYPAVSVRFNGKEIIQIAKRLSSLEIQSCGEFSLINLDSDLPQLNKNDPFLQQAKFAEIQHKALKLSMINPTYEQVEKMLLKNAGVEGFRERMRELVEKIHFEKDVKIQKAMEHEYAMLELRSKFFFPEDFLIDMFTFATSQDISDIKLLVSEEILLNAAITAEKGSCRVSDILCKDGVFSEFNKQDVDLRGAIILQEYRNKKK